MYTKIGLGALALAGLTFGAVGMLTSAGASPADCRAPSSGISAPASSGSNGSASNSSTDTDANKDANKDADKTKKPATKGNQPGPSKPGTTQPNQGSNDPGGSADPNGSGGSGSGNGDGTDGGNNGNGNLLTIDGSTNTPSDTDVNVTVPNGSAPGAGSTSGDTTSNDRPFLDLLGRTKTVQTPAGTVPVPPTDASLIGRSWYIGSLLQVTGRANAGS